MLRCLCSLHQLRKVKQKFQLDEKRKEVNKVQSQITEKKKASKGQDKCLAPSAQDQAGLQSRAVLKGETYLQLKTCHDWRALSPYRWRFVAAKNWAGGRLHGSYSSKCFLKEVQLILMLPMFATVIVIGSSYTCINAVTNEWCPMMIHLLWYKQLNNIKYNTPARKQNNIKHIIAAMLITKKINIPT